MKRRLKRLMQNNGGAFQIPRAGLAAAFDANTGITSSGGFASAWADQSGNGRNLLQATGANQPIHLPYSGEKYGWLPGVAGNYFSTPDSVAASITGDIDIRVKAALTDWTPAGGSNATFVSKWDNATRRSYFFGVEAVTGKLIAYTSADGSTITNSAIVSTVATGVTDGATKWVRMTYASATGKFNFYTGDDGISWTQLGAADVSGTASAIFDSTSIVEVGSLLSAATWLASGKIYAAQIYNGINGTLAVDFNASRYAGGTTLTGSTGEAWTINSTGSKPAQIVDRPSLLFDGAAHYMKTAAFTLNQPETVYLVAKQVSWALNDYFFDGLNANSGLIQNAATPNIALYAGSAVVATNGNLAVGSNAVICSIMNGAGSLIQVNQTTATTGNPGAINMSGFTLGAASNPTAYGNIQAYEALIYSAAHDAATRANVIRALMSKHGVA